MLIDINEKYAISTIDLNYVLQEKKVITGNNKRGIQAKEENIGKIRYLDIAYFPSIKALSTYLINKEIIDSDCTEIADIYKVIDRVSSDFQAVFLKHNEKHF